MADNQLDVLENRLEILEKRVFGGCDKDALYPKVRYGFRYVSRLQLFCFFPFFYPYNIVSAKIPRKKNSF